MLDPYADLRVITVYYEVSTLFFFFSSRRRHTRLQGDWSSDVCSSDLSNLELSKDFSNFFQKNNINSQKISEFLRTIIEKDSQELISTPFKHISATDIRSLHKFTPPSFISGNFLDPESYTTANTLHSIFHNSKWDALMEFDNDNSLGQLDRKSVV